MVEGGRGNLFASNVFGGGADIPASGTAGMWSTGDIEPRTERRRPWPRERSAVGERTPKAVALGAARRPLLRSGGHGRLRSVRGSIRRGPPYGLAGVTGKTGAGLPGT